MTALKGASFQPPPARLLGRVHGYNWLPQGAAGNQGCHPRVTAAPLQRTEADYVAQGEEPWMHMEHWAILISERFSLCLITFPNLLQSGYPFRPERTRELPAPDSHPSQDFRDKGDKMSL